MKRVYLSVSMASKFGNPPRESIAPSQTLIVEGPYATDSYPDFSDWTRQFNGFS
jgi:hypothetical protein